MAKGVSNRMTSPKMDRLGKRTFSNLADRRRSLTIQTTKTRPTRARILRQESHRLSGVPNNVKSVVYRQFHVRTPDTRHDFLR